VIRARIAHEAAADQAAERPRRQRPAGARSQPGGQYTVSAPSGTPKVGRELQASAHRHSAQLVVTLIYLRPLRVALRPGGRRGTAHDVIATIAFISVMRSK